MALPDVLYELQQRALIAQLSDAAALKNTLSQGSLTLYSGFDPTADSLHLGHLIPLLTLKRFQQAGHRPICLVGGATGMIGDPSFKASERQLNDEELIVTWADKIRQQTLPFLDFDCGEHSAIVVNNATWFGQMNVLHFLRNIGKHFSVNAMINKESVKQRISRDEVGISFTEFSYSLLQAYDFVELNRRYGCRLQIGGSDQWGNITAGIDLTRRLNQALVFGLTQPLVTRSDGTKFGKTESGTVWLDAKKTSPYQFYQFWLGSTDTDVERFLRFFTFLSIEHIDELSQAGQADALTAQRTLAEAATELVHGPVALQAAQRISRSLFSEDPSALNLEDFEQLALDGLPTVMLSPGQTLIDALVAGHLASSKSQARQFIESGAVRVNENKCTDLHYVFKDSDRRFERYTLLRRGKKHYCLLISGIRGQGSGIRSGNHADA